MSERPLRECAHCGKQGKGMALCRGCCAVRYCNVECQKADRASHKSKCRATGPQEIVVNAMLSRAENGTAEMLERFRREIEGQFVKKVVTMEDVEETLQCMATMMKFIRPRQSEEKARREEMVINGTTLPLHLVYNHIELRGKRVFSTKRLPADVIVTFHPCDALWYRGQKKMITFPSDPATDLTSQDKDIVEAYCFAIGCPSKEGLIDIVGNPRRPLNTRLLGHFVKDGVSNPFAGHSMTEMKKKKALFNTCVLNYLRETSKRCNCQFLINKNRTVAAVSTVRPVEEGEELCISNGMEYWLELNYGEGQVPFMADTLSQMRPREWEEFTRLLESIFPGLT